MSALAMNGECSYSTSVAPARVSSAISRPSDAALSKAWAWCAERYGHDDATQALVNALQAIDNGEEVENLPAYLHTLTRHVGIDRARRRNFRRTDSYAAPDAPDRRNALDKLVAREELVATPAREVIRALGLPVSPMSSTERSKRARRKGKQ